MQPLTHPDFAFASRLQDPNSEPFQTSNDRRRGFVPKSASIHSISPSNPSNHSPPAPYSSGKHTPDYILGKGSAGNSLFTNSPLQTHIVPGQTAQMAVPPGLPATYGPNSNTNTNFNFNDGANGHGHMQNLQNIWGLRTDPPQSQPMPQAPPPMISQVDDFQVPAGDMGFDWMNWMSTANVSMGPVDEQYGVQ